MWHTECCKDGTLAISPRILANDSKVHIEETEEEEGAKEENGEASGLTPDWIIHAAAHEVFLLEVPVTCASP